MDTSDAEEFTEAFVGFVRGFGLLEPEHTPCGGPMSTAEAHALTILRTGGLLQGALGDRLGLRKSTMSRLVDALEQRGWVRREADPRDGRAWVLVLTDKGREVAVEVIQRRARRLSALLDHIPSAQRPAVVERCDSSRTQDNRMRRNLAATLTVLLAALGACAAPEQDQPQTSRQAAVAERGEQVTTPLLG